MRGRGKKWVKVGVGVCVTALALWLSFRNLEWRTLVDRFSNVNLFWVILAIANSLFMVYALGWRWQILLRPKGKSSLNELFRLNIISQYVNIMAPARLGEIVKAYLASKKHTASGAYIAGTIVIEKILDFYVFVLLWTLIPAIFALQGEFRHAGIAVFFCFLSGFILASFIWKPEIFLKWTTRLSKVLPSGVRDRVSGFLERGIEAFHQLRSGRTLAVLLFFTFGLVTGRVLTNFLLFKAFNLQLSFWVALVVMLALQIGNIPPSVPGKVGIFEYATILALSFFSVSKAGALSYAILLHLVAFLPKIILGGIFITQVDLKKSLNERS